MKTGELYRIARELEARGDEKAAAKARALFGARPFERQAEAIVAFAAGKHKTN